MLWRLREIESMNVAGADQRLTSQVHEIVGRINGRYGSVTFVPIHHLASSLVSSVFPSCCLFAACVGGWIDSCLVQLAMNLERCDFIW